MTMELFYTNEIRNEQAFFSEEESRHMMKAYRKRPGDEVRFTDGQGLIYTGVLFQEGKRTVGAHITETTHQERSWSGKLTMAVAPTKNFNRIEWLIEKLVELGVDRIVPIMTERSERKKWKHDRVQRIVVAAMKQSLKAHLPEIIDPVDFKDFVRSWDSELTVYIGHCEEGQKLPLPNIVSKDGDVCFCVGPEGDFSPDEIKEAITSGAEAIDLGRERLRTETAAFKMAVAFHLQNDLI
jgi:16S rRNA (uracil1498-N3)-methyltransferase